MIPEAALTKNLCILIFWVMGLDVYKINKKIGHILFMMGINCAEIVIFAS